MKMTAQTASRRSDYPILEDWAREVGVKIEWIHLWQTKDSERATAFGYAADGRAMHNTLVVMNEGTTQ